MGLKKIFAVCIALGILVFVSCKQNSDSETDFFYCYIYPVQSEDKIVGTWVASEYENYTITSTTFDNGYYAGSTTYIRYTSSDSGYIYFKYTKAALPDWTYSESAPDVGKWYCVAFKNLKANSISLSGAWKDASAGGKTSTATLEEAAKEFTVENEYFAIYSECERKS